MTLYINDPNIRKFSMTKPFYFVSSLSAPCSEQATTSLSLLLNKKVNKSVHKLLLSAGDLSAEDLRISKFFVFLCEIYNAESIQLFFKLG